MRRNDSGRASLNDMDAVGRVKACFAERFGHDRCRVVRAPGRVNLIGEHTDYNDGFVFPVAIDRYVTIAFAPRTDNEIRGYSIDFEAERRAGFDELTPLSDTTKAPSWFDYVAGVAWVLRNDRVLLSGLDFVVSGDVPMGAGLSSSAALEVATTRAFIDVSKLDWEGEYAARVGQRVEVEYIGLNSGIMDQMASSLAREGAAMLLDCRDLSYRHIPIPDSLSVVVMDTGTRRSVATSAYNDRRASCERVVEVIARTQPEVRALRDVSEADLEAGRSRLDPTDYRRALHVVRENARTQSMARALESVDKSALRELMAGSHESLRDLYEVSSTELDEMVSIAQSHPACFGARMTGAGFGGCAVALVSAASGDLVQFTDSVGSRYAAGELYVCNPGGGAQLLG
jgi:galactokinase